MNTLENKAKFFAQYWGQEVLSEWGDDLIKVSGKIDRVYDISEMWLELKPLSSISDEDAIKIFNHIFPNHLPTDNEEKIETIKGIFESDFRPHKFLDLYESTRFIDKARELNYALDYNGITVEQQIEYGWIILKKS